MPGGFPLGLELSNAVDFGTSSSHGTVVASGAANTVGSFVQLTASTTVDACWIAAIVSNTATAASLNIMADIAIGAAAAEKVIISNLVNSTATTTVLTTYLFPCSIPSGTRISARSQTVLGTENVDVAVVLFDGAFTQMEGAAGVDSIGWVAAATTGSTVDPGATANTKGAWTQLVASTARDYIGFSLSIDTLGVSPATGHITLTDIGIGAASSELVILPNIEGTRNAQIPGPQAIGPFFIPIKAGTRVAARGQSSTNVTPSRTYGVTLYGIYQ